ncbi:hypothetical protein MUK42_28505 [Musa troglodytarum]|uniref:DUF7906 domain-containing protein n=1 Tax=Musa troglodytarum TaxID=320322 RepID=A0A9E7F0G1_9LILI|nr:hypothetical protein MUK42_28505 [Musa troglodytarum]
MGGAATLGLDAFLAGEARRDPSAANDSFTSLPAALKRTLAASLPSADHATLVSQLLSLQISVPVYVKLVGDFSSAAPGIIRSFASAALTSDRFHVIGATPHHLRENTNSAPGFYIYLLNLGSQSKPYAYSLDSKDASLAFTKCLGTLWTGKDRYVWIDLAAGPVEYGPAISGEGVIPRGEFHPLSSLHGRPRSEKALLSDLTSVVLSEQSLVFKSYNAKFSECPICSYAIARSTNSYTSRFLFENYTLIVSEYLDSKRLHQILSDSVEEVRRAAAIPEEEEYGKVLPVYVFDLEYDKLLLLDRYHQAIAFRNMVIAVRTRSSQTVSDYSCNGRHVITQTRNLDRPIIGSVLQSMWGVSPTHLSWSPQHNSTLVDYTWSVGQTPFGPFSETSFLSFIQRDAARRNVLLTSLNYTITSAIDVLQSMAVHGGDRKLLKERKHVEFVQRWNLLKYKLEKVVSGISHFDFEKAMYFLRSSDHDLYAIHTLIYEASQKLEALLVCFKDPPFPWASVSLFGVFLFGFCYVYAKRDKILKSKRKQF